MKNKHSGSLFEDFLKDEGISEEVTAAAVKRTIVMQLEKQMEKQHKNKNAFRKALKSPTTASRLFSDHTGTELETLIRAANVVDCDVVIFLQPRKAAKAEAKKAVLTHRRTSLKIAGGR